MALSLPLTLSLPPSLPLFPRPPLARNPPLCALLQQDSQQLDPRRGHLSLVGIIDDESSPRPRLHPSVTPHDDADLARHAAVSISDLTDAVEAINEDILLEDDNAYDLQRRFDDQPLPLPTELEVALNPKRTNPPKLRP